jgi:transcriptional regulator with XRE-family HTH domain
MKSPYANSPISARYRISCNLKRLRLERGLSQERAAELADFHRTYVSQLERCVTNISIDGLERLAHALGVDVVDLLRPTEPEMLIAQDDNKLP